MTRSRSLTRDFLITLSFGIGIAVPALCQSVMPQLLPSVQHDVSRPLWEMAMMAQLRPPAEQEVVPVGALPRPQATGLADTVVQSAPGPQLAVNPGLNFSGIGQGAYGYTVMYVPSDVNGAAGATQYVQWVNVNFAVFDKATGNLVAGPMAGNTLWTGFGGYCETNNNGDPIAQYDKAAQRWVMTQFSLNYGGPFYQCVAVSTTSDATGTYNRYAFQFADFPDYPKLAVWPDGYYMSFNIFDPYGNYFIGAEACALDRNSMLAGAAASAICFPQDTTVEGLLPSDLDGSTPPPAGSPNYYLDYGVNSLNLWQFHADFVTPANSTFTGPVNIPVSPFTPLCGGGRTCVPQGQTSQQLDGLSDRLMYRFAYRNFGAYESLVVNHSVQANSGGGVRWYELRSPGSNPVVYQQGTFAPDSNYRWMGSIAMDRAGDIALGYSISSSALVPSIYYTGRIPTDPLGQMETESSAAAGAGYQTTYTRWGDYTSMSIDPVDDCTFWYTNQYLLASGVFNWSTRIVNFSFPGCTSVNYSSLTVTKAGNGPGTVTSTPAGVSCGKTCTAAFVDGTKVALKAKAGANSVFGGWGGACTGTAACRVTMIAATAVTATFNSTLPSYMLAVTEAGAGNGTVTSAPAGISCQPTCSAPFLSGKVVTLTATPDASSRFAGWSGSCSGTAHTCKLTMTADAAVTANFSVLKYTLRIQETGTGTVTSDSGGISCPGTCAAAYLPGTMVTLTATPAAGASFGSWGAPCNSTSPTCTVTVTAAMSVTANFVNPVLTVKVPDQGGLITSSPAGISCRGTCSASFPPQSAVTLTITPDKGNTFGHWTGDCSGTQKTCTVTMDGNKSVSLVWN